MKSIHRKLLALATHEGTPQEEALVAVRKLAEMIERGHDSNFRVTSYNSTRDRIAELEAEIILLKARLDAQRQRDPIRERNLLVRNDFKAGATRSELMDRYGLGRTQLWKILRSSK